METTSIECVGISGYPRSKIIRKQIGLRVACAVGCLTILICAAVTLQGLSEAEYSETKYNSVAEFLITVGLVGMIAESVLTVIHYLPITIINQHFTLFGVGDVIIDMIFIIFLLSGGIASIAYFMENLDTYNNDYCHDTDEDKTEYDTSASQRCNTLLQIFICEISTGFFCFTTTIKFGSLAYNMISTIKQKRQENSESPKEVNNMQNPVMQ